MLSYIEISKDRLLDNYRAFKAFVNPSVKIINVVKANAYGHGQDEVVSVLNNRVDYFAVDDLPELRQLRELSPTATFVLGYVEKDELKEIIDLNGILTVYDWERLEEINSIGKKSDKKIPVDIKIDALLGRQGFLLHEVGWLTKKLKTLDYLNIGFIHAHFANIEDTQDPGHSQKQIRIFNRAVRIFKESGWPDIKPHISSTAGILVHEKNYAANPLVRLGIGLYGMYPSEYLKKQFHLKGLKLEPVMRWVTHVAQVKILPLDFPVGYGLTYVTRKKTKVAVIPQGYSDGYDRGLSNCGEVLIGGKRCPVLGRVAMNMFVVDVTHVAGVKAGDEVILLGETITAESIAEKLGTINYEVTARISPILPRIVAG